MKSAHKIFDRHASMKHKNPINNNHNNEYSILKAQYSFSAGLKIDWFWNKNEINWKFP